MSGVLHGTEVAAKAFAAQTAKAAADKATAAAISETAKATKEEAEAIAADSTSRRSSRCLKGTHSASPVYADGRIYFLSEEGTATVIEPGHEFHELASNQLDGSTLASMAVSNGSIFIRSDTHLYRIGAKGTP